MVEEYVYGSVAKGYGPQVGSRVNVPEYMIKDGRKYRFLTDHHSTYSINSWWTQLMTGLGSVRMVQLTILSPPILTIMEATFSK